ncbi:MAG: ferritin-like domain-containing protein [Bifidobacteriaceae bacterium]|jgi:hypothetical protein|nr:ferritin-like domain-containing protein [Bifidobacteriaceae bacterium]
MDWPDAVIREGGASAPVDPVGARARYESWGIAKGADGALPAPRSPERAAAVSVLAFAAAAKQTAFCHHARDAAASDRVAIRVTMADIAAAEQDRCALARRRLGELGVDAFSEMTPYLRELAGFDRGLSTDQWWERTLGSYLAHGIAVDMQRTAAARLDPLAAGLLAGLLEDCAGADYLRALLVHAIRGDGRREARLSLWGRRVAGDALGVATGMVARIPAMAELFSQDSGAGSLHAELSAEHSRRMDGLGLSI